MKIIVTGGAGFIASHIVDAYIQAGHRVVVIDNLSTGFEKNINSRAKFYREDIRNRGAIEAIIKKERPEVVNHHAAIAEVVKSLRDPIPTLEVNVTGTVNILTAAGAAGIKKFIFSSTGGAIYGEPKKIPATEKTIPTPLSPYGLSKHLGEECIKFYAKRFGFDYTIFRYPNVYGPRQNPKGEAGVVAIFGDLMRTGQQPIIFGDGTKARDYTYVSDIVRANRIALRKGKNEILNLGWGKKITDQMIFDTIARAVVFVGKPIYAPARAGEVYQIALETKKARKILGWKPTISLPDGVTRTMKALSRSS